MAPDEQVFRDHIAQGPFQSGEANGRWRLLDIVWPIVYIAVTAAERDQAPTEFAFQFNCENYPATPPTAKPWNREGEKPLEHNMWPIGSGNSRVQKAFNPGWNGGQALYLPCDRLAIHDHGQWLTQHPDMIWSRDKDITFYLRIIYDLLHSSTYTGVRSA